MRRLLPLALAAALAACGAPAAQVPTPAAPTPTAAGQPGPTVTPGGPTPTAPAVAPTVPPGPSPTTVASAAPLGAIGYGQALSAAFLGADTLAVGTSAGLLLLGLPDLAPRQFVPVDVAAAELAASPDGRYLAASSYDGPTAFTRLLDGAGAELATLPGRQPLFSRDGGLLGVAELDSGTGRYTTRLYDPDDPARPVAEAPGDRAVLSPDGSVLATFDLDEVVITAVGGQESFRGPASSAAFSPDGSLVAIGGLAGAEVLPLVSGSAVAAGRRSLSAELMLGLAFDSSGALLGLSNDALLRWDLASGAEVQRVPVPVGPAFGRISPGAAIVALVEAGGDAPSQLRLVRADGRALYVETQFEGGDPFFSPDGSRAAVVTDGGVLYLVDADQGVQGERLVSGYEAVSFGGEDLYLARQGLRGLERWQPAGSAPEAAIPVASAWLARARELTVAGGRVVVEQEVGNIMGGSQQLAAGAWDGAPGPFEGLVVAEIPADEQAHGERTPWDYSPAAAILARGVAPSAGGGLLLIDRSGEGRPLPALAGVPAGVAPTSIAISPDGARLAVGYGDGTLLIAQVADLSPVAAGPLGAGEAITVLAWSGDGSRVAFALAGGDVAVWEVGEDESPVRVAAPRAESGAPSLALSADGATLAVGASTGLGLYTTADGAERLRLPVPAESVALGESGLLAAISRGQVLVWRAPS